VKFQKAAVQNRSSKAKAAKKDALREVGNAAKGWNLE
jgi:hypothetical protein